METIEWADFERVAICVGTVIRCELNEAARKPAYKLWVDCGSYGVKASSAQLTKHYTPKDLLGRQVVAVVNFPPKRVAGFESQCLVTGFADAHGDVVLAIPERAVPNGSRLY
jgi:tRNA-binding protein